MCRWFYDSYVIPDYYNMVYDQTLAFQSFRSDYPCDMNTLPCILYWAYNMHVL